MALQYVRSLFFNFQMYVAMLVIGVACLPWALVSPAGGRAGCKAFCSYVVWSARWMVGLRSEVRGPVPTGEVMIAAKHQSFLDIIMIFNAVPRGKFIMKRELLFTPILGQYAWRIGCVPVDRGKRGAAVSKMLADVDRGKIASGQLIIYPQGTRVAPGVPAPYKVGSHVLYEQLGQPCVPVAVNVGVFWPRHAVLRKPGLAVVEFLPTIEPGLDRRTFLTTLEGAVESRSNALMAEAGFTALPN